MPSEQHLPYRSTADVVVLDGDGSRWVREDAVDERDMRIPYRLGTDQYCKFEDCDEYVHMGDLVTIYVHPYQEDPYSYCGNLCGVQYDSDGFIRSVSLSFDDEFALLFVDFGRAFYQAETTNDFTDLSDRRRALCSIRPERAAGEL